MFSHIRVSVFNLRSYKMLPDSGAPTFIRALKTSKLRSKFTF